VQITYISHSTCDADSADSLHVEAHSFAKLPGLHLFFIMGIVPNMTSSRIIKGDNFEAVREYVREELCQKNQLEKDAFQMSERVLTRNGKPCGFYFCIYGPRSVRLTAVWDLTKGSVFFYDSLGRRAAASQVPAFS